MTAEKQELAVPGISVEWEDLYSDCGQDGCSGSEGVRIRATQGAKVVEVEAASCFGIDHAALIEELLERWSSDLE